MNRGLAILGDTLFMGTIDAHLIAIDAKNGKPLWNTTVAKAEAGYAITHAPLIVKDKVIVGMAGGEYGIRGFIAAYDAKTGKEAWRFYTIPGPGEPGHETWAGDSWKTGGASVWMTGSYDPDPNLTYWGIGNPGPDWNGDLRAGDNLYSDSVVALDADTGKLKWYYQFSPHDEFDYDSVQVPVLADIGLAGPAAQGDDVGQPQRPVLRARPRQRPVPDGQAFREGELDASGFDEKGRPMRISGKVPTAEGTLIFPGNQGGTNWYSPSYSPRTGLFYIPSWVNYSSIYTSSRDRSTSKGGRSAATSPRSLIGGLGGAKTNNRREDEGYGAVRAIDPKTGDRKWEFKMTDVTDAGILTTASDLLFSGGREGLLLCARCAQRRAAVEGERGRRRGCRTHVVCGQRQAVHSH